LVLIKRERGETKKPGLTAAGLVAKTAEGPGGSVL
jgi:hypothetical protein